MSETLHELRISAQANGVNLDPVSPVEISQDETYKKNAIQPQTPERKNSAFLTHKNRIGNMLDSLEQERKKLILEIGIFPNNSVKEIYRICEISMEIELYLSCYDSPKYRGSVQWRNRLKKFRAIQKRKTGISR